MNVALPEAPTLREICDTFSSVCSFPTAPSIPLVLLRAAAYVGSGIACFQPEFPVTRSNLRKLTTSTAVSIVRLRETLPELSFPTFRKALLESADFYRIV
jgi:hypothetical protein